MSLELSLIDRILEDAYIKQASSKANSSLRRAKKIPLFGSDPLELIDYSEICSSGNRIHELADKKEVF